MAPKYKLTYFDLRALGECIRFLFAYGEIEYEDNRLDPADWPKHKSSYPNGKVPVLETEGQTVNQSTAIARFVARRVGLAGADDLEAMLIDSAVENLNDVRLEFVGATFAADEELKAQNKKKFFEEVLPTYFSRLEAQVKSNNGYLVNGKLSWADMYLASYSETFTHFFKDLFAPYPALQGVIDKVYALPTIKAWIAKRPKTDI